MADLYSATTGVEADEENMRTCAHRIYTLERSFSIREGITAEDDFLQGKWVNEATRGGPFEGSSLDQEKFGKMLGDYYLQRGWNPMTGIPTSETLEKLGLHGVVTDLQKMGKC